MTKEEYSNQLKDIRWFKKRNKILAHDKFKCANCDSTEHLEVHHLYYIEGKKAWQYPNDALITWCSECHEEWHDTHHIIVRKKAFSEGKKRKFKPPIKKVKKIKNRKPKSAKFLQLIEFNKLAIPLMDRKSNWRLIRGLSIQGRQEVIDVLKERYGFQGN